MPNLLRNILAVLAGVIVGSIVNMTLIALSATIIPPPAGVDVSTAEGLSQGIHLFQPRHFLMPFLAHALGTLVGAFVAYLAAGFLHRPGSSQQTSSWRTCRWRGWECSSDAGWVVRRVQRSSGIRAHSERDRNCPCVETAMRAPAVLVIPSVVEGPG